jgi:hypothetical protein
LVDRAELGVNNNNSVKMSPMSHIECVHRGGGFLAAGFGGSFGGPGRADVD